MKPPVIEQNLISRSTQYANFKLAQDKIFKEFFAHRIGIIQNYDAETNTATIVIVDVEQRTVDIDTIINENLAPLPNVPIFRNATQNAGFTKPILVGDTVLLCFNDTNIDNFLENPSIQVPLLNSIRHDCNHAIAVPYDFSPWLHNNTATEMFYGNIKISLSGGNITFTTENSQQIVIDSNGNMAIAGNLTIAGNLIVNGGEITMGTVALKGIGGKETINGKETAVIGGATNGGQNIITSGQ